jgi:arylsulfatase A-like enzyme
MTSTNTLDGVLHVKKVNHMTFPRYLTWAAAGIVAVILTSAPAAAQNKPNIVMLMTDDTGWGDFGAYSGGGLALGHPTPNVDRIAKEGAVFTSWYGQASCTAGRASFMTGRIPIRSALSIVVAPGDENFLRKETPTIAEFFQKNCYSTYFSGKWHLGDKPEAYPTEHGFDGLRSKRTHPALRLPGDRARAFFTQPAAGESAAVFTPPPTSDSFRHGSPADVRRACPSA